MSGGGYDPGRFALLARVEDRHFWFRARRTLISRLSASLTASLPSGFHVLDFGCGTGYTLGALEQGAARGVTIGMDRFHEGLAFGLRRGHKHLVQADACCPPFIGTFNLIGAFDVIEHLPNDIEIFERLAGLLKPGGHLLVTVPAHPSLWSEFDVLSAHCRRYTEEDLRTKLAASGLEIIRSSPYMATILPIVWFYRKFRRTTGQEQSGGPDAERRFQAEFRVVPVVNEILGALLWLESEFLARGGRIPFGTSLMAIARKKGET